MRVIFLSIAAVCLTACADLGRAPWQNDAQCIRQQMAPPENLMFDLAYTTCVAPVGGQALTGSGAHYPPAKLQGAPDLQAQARAAGIAYTD